jgi:hypothetical protein
MPSDCQCSCYREPETIIKVVKKVITNKEAADKISRLEKEVSKLVSENRDLKRRLKTATVNKKRLIDEVKAKLDGI